MSSSDKRRRARVQGSWAPPPRKSAGELRKERTQDVRGQQSNPGAIQHQSTDSNSVQSNTERQAFRFVDTGMVKRREPSPIRIEKEEPDYILSEEPSGVSRVRYFPNFISEMELESIFNALRYELPWEKKYGVTREGKQYLQPRLITWFGDMPYSYSGVTLDPNPEWHPYLVSIKADIEKKVGHKFNSVLGNFYRDEHDSVDWHSDDEKTLGENPYIASISLGELRNFEMRKKTPPEENDDYTYQKKVRIPLLPGSLLIMEGATQADWQHRIPKENHSRGPRINLTFRTIYPEETGKT